MKQEKDRRGSYVNANIFLNHNLSVDIINKRLFAEMLSLAIYKKIFRLEPVYPFLIQTEKSLLEL